MGSGGDLSPSITATHLQQYSSAHCVCVELSGAFWYVAVISQYHQFSYKPEVHIDYLDLLLSRLGYRRVIIGMDLNGRSPQWSCRVQAADERGLLLEEVIHRHGLAAVYRPGHPSTLVRGDKDVEITLVTSELEALVGDWTVREGWMTADHRPISNCLRERVASGVSRTPRYNVRRANRGRYGKGVSRLLEEVSCTDPAKQEGNTRGNVTRSYALSLGSGATSSEGNARNASWHSFVTTNTSGDVYGFIYKMTSEKIAPKSAVNSLIVGDSSTAGWSETATALLDGFFADPTTQDRVISPSQGADVGVWSELEVSKAVRSMKCGKCPGEDMKEAEIVKVACGYGFLRPLTRLMNACLRLGRFPSSWKTVAICVLLKSPDKDRLALKSYRPVCLVPVLSKVLERLIKWRLLPVISNKDHASSRQFGFRAERCTADAIGLARSIVSGSEKPLAFGILFNITGAFDNLRWDSVMEELATCDSRVTRRVKKGAPQGSILGPDMWNMCMDPVLWEVQERGGEIVAYADDLLPLVTGGSRTECEVRGQSKLSSELARTRGIRLSNSKKALRWPSRVMTQCDFCPVL
uniref:Reverse transcriptase domain-containing protein n=1 Tax=Trichogramma kaykai TaxID=54128 RepID=A0ABD2W6X9_9HYME